MDLPGVKAAETPRRDDFGRPTDYRPEYADQARKLFERGATDVEVAEFFDVHVSTLYRWRHSNEDFLHAVKVGKEHADERVKVAYHKIASGYTYTEQQAIKVKDGPHSERVEIVEVQREAPPNPAAVMKWLSARTPEFRETQRVEMNAKVENISLDFSKFTDEELIAYKIAMEAIARNNAGGDSSNGSEDR